MENTALPITKKSQLTQIQCYIFYFFIFSILGWILETLYSYLALGHFTNRGFFYGPICPIYGSGALILILFLNKYQHNPFKLFITAMIVFSIFEYAIGYSLDALYNLWLWDYRTELLNINGRICLSFSLVWGVAALFFAYIIYPLFQKFVKKLLAKTPIKIQLIILRIISMIFVIDILYSFIEYSNI